MSTNNYAEDPIRLEPYRPDLLAYIAELQDTVNDWQDRYEHKESAIHYLRKQIDKLMDVVTERDKLKAENGQLLRKVELDNKTPFKTKGRYVVFGGTLCYPLCDFVGVYKDEEAAKIAALATCREWFNIVEVTNKLVDLTDLEG